MPHYDYYFDDAAAEAAIEFFPRYLRHSKGAFAGQAFKLDTWQAKDVIGPFFGWKRKDNNRRRYRTCYLRVPRKNGKSTLCSGVSVLALVGEAQPGAEVYCAATDKRQALIVFNEAKQMIMASPDLQRLCDSFKNTIYCSAINGRIEALSAEAKTKDGLNTFALIIDEMHAHQSRDLYDVLHTSQGAWAEPIEFIATTAGKNRNSFGYEMDEYALKVRDGVIEDEEFLPVIYGAAADDDWRKEETWRKANPGYGISLQADYMRSQARQAEEMPAYQNTFKQLHLNIWIDAATKAIPKELWDENTGELGWQVLERELEGRVCHAGIDLSSTTDLTALVLVFPPDEEDGDWYALPRFFVPADNIAKRARRDRVPYGQWRDEGAMIATEGNVIDYRAIREQLVADGEQFRIASIGYDPWNATQLALELQEQGFPMFEFRQGFASMAYPTREFFRLLEGRKILHGSHPVLKWCASNLCVQTDAAGNAKPDKSKSTDRIDGVVAQIIAIGRATAVDNGAGKSVYEKRGILVI